MRAKRNPVKRAITRFLIALMMVTGFQSGLGTVGEPANATATLITEDGSNSSGWNSSGYYDANYPLVSTTQGNPGSAFAFNKNTTVSKTFGTSGADFSGSKIKLQVRFKTAIDQFGIYWGKGSASGTGITNSLWIGTGQNPASGDRLAGKGGITTNVSVPNLYWHGVSGGISGTGNANVTSGLWEINRWYEIEIAINATSTSYSIDGVLIQTKTSALPNENVVTMGLDDRNGYNFFNGFYVDNITITPAPPTMSVEYVSNGANGSMSTQLSNAPANLSANTFAKPGSTFIGWNTAANGSGAFYSDGSPYSFGENIILYAQWSSDSVPINYNTDGGSFVSGSSVAIGSAIQSAPTAPTKSGYTFGGWKTASGSSAVTFPYYPILSNEFSTSVSTAALVDLGRYENKGTWVSSTWYGPNRNAPWSTRDFVTYTDGRKYIAIRESNNTVLANPTRLDGYYMVPLDSSTTLKAIWVADLHQITYALAGGTSALPTQADVATGGSFVAAAAPVRNGYTFGGWSDGAVTTMAGASYSVGVGNITLSALWTQNSYSVTYDSKNGVASSVVSVAHGSTPTAPADPTWYGYNFKGWSETLNGALADLTSISISTIKTFYAIWEQKSLAGFTSAQLGVADTIAPSSTMDKSVTSNLGHTTTVVKVPAGSLPSTFTVKVFTLADNTFAEQTLGANNSYIISQVISWNNSSNGNIEDTAAGKPIEMTITSPDIKAGSKVYSILDNVSTLLAIATQDGEVRVSFSSDPVIVVQAAPIVVAAPISTPTPTPAPTSTPTSTPTPSPISYYSKSINVLGFNPGSWKLNTVIKHLLDAFVKAISGANKINCIGYTAGPTVLKGDAKLAARRGQVVCSYLIARNPALAHVYIKGITTKISSDFYRRTRVTVSDK